MDPDQDLDLHSFLKGIHPTSAKHGLNSMQPESHMERSGSVVECLAQG